MTPATRECELVPVRAAGERRSVAAGEVVLVSGGEHVGTLAAVRALRDAGYEPWVAVSTRGAYAARSRAAAGAIEVPDPAEDDEGFAAALAGAARRIEASVVLPGTEAGLLALSERTGEFPADTALGVCPSGVVLRATDKALLARLSSAAGLAAPPTIALDAREAPERELPFPFPAVVKPPRSELRTPEGAIRHAGARRVDSPEELRSALAALPAGRGLVQPYLAGCLASLAGVFWDGRILGAVQSVADRIWPEHCGTMSYATTVPLDVRLTASVGDLLGALGWKGLFQVDFIDRGGSCVLIDLNPRIYTSLAIATAAGLNLPAIWVDLLRGRRPVGVGAYRLGVRYRHDEDDARALLALWRRGSRRTALRGSLPRRRTVHAVFSIRDPLPLLTTVAKLGRRGRPAGREPGVCAHPVRQRHEARGEADDAPR